MKRRLELTWIGKEDRPWLEPRILLEDPVLSYTAAERVSENDIFDNRLIFGDNLLALKALEQEFAGKVKCIFIDPPYNTGSAFTQYDDGLEHSLWLSMIRDRLELLYRLLAEDGSIWITIDDNEAHYLKVLCDEIFGRANFVGSITWEKSDSPRMDAHFFSARHDYLLVFAKSIDALQIHRIGGGEADAPSHYDKVDEDGRRYYLKPLRAMGGQGDSRLARPNLYFGLVDPDGGEVFPIKQDGTDGAWRWSREKISKEKNRIEWVKSRTGAWTPYFRIYADSQPGRPIETIWFHADVGSNRTSKAEAKALVPESPFDTPKPEGLIKRILEAATLEGDLVLDSFAGSGTTGAVAHKMGRRWIMVEVQNSAHTHIIPRMRKVIDGADQGGISKAVNWKGGGGFRYFRLAPSLLKQDKWGRWVINEDYNPEMLAEAICKLEGHRYAPSDSVYWQHGQSTERSYIYVTTQTLTHEQLQDLSDSVGPDRSLLVSAMAFRDARPDAYPNLTLKKIPHQVLNRCEWGHDDYSLKVENLPMATKPVVPQTGLFESGEAGE